LLRKAAGTLNFAPLDPVKALIWSAIINGVAAVPLPPNIVGAILGTSAAGWAST
jgi:hypothetical protein